MRDLAAALAKGTPSQEEIGEIASRYDFSVALSTRAQAPRASMGGRSMDLTRQPAVVAALEHHRHPVGVPRNALFACRSLRPLGQEPGERSSDRDIVAIPLPRVGRLALDVAVEESPQLVGAAKQRLLGGDYDQVRVKGAYGKDRVRVPARESRAETIENLDQLTLVSPLGAHSRHDGTLVEWLPISGPAAPPSRPSGGLAAARRTPEMDEEQAPVSAAARLPR